MSPTPGFTLDSFVLHLRCTSCARCGATSEQSELFEVQVPPPGSRYAVHLLPARVLEPGYPIGTLRLPPRELPVCHVCIGGMTEVPGVRYDSEAAWRESLTRKLHQAPSPRAHATPTLEDL